MGLGLVLELGPQFVVLVSAKAGACVCVCRMQRSHKWPKSTRPAAPLECPALIASLWDLKRTGVNMCVCVCGVLSRVYFLWLTPVQS